MTTEAISQRVLARFEKSAMAVVLRNVANHNWGWFSREDPRMHLQTVEDDARSGPNSAKVWLEDRGRRICETASGKVDLKKLQAKVKTERKNIEARWIDFMIKNGWLTVTLNGSVARLTVYPGSHYQFTRDIDLRDEFPGAYKGQRSWELNPPNVDLDSEHAALAVGTETNLDDREHIDLTKWVFVD